MSYVSDNAKFVPRCAMLSGVLTLRQWQDLEKAGWKVCWEWLTESCDEKGDLIFGDDGLPILQQEESEKIILPQYKFAYFMEKEEDAALTSFESATGEDCYYMSTDGDVVCPFELKFWTENADGSWDWEY